MFNEILFYFNLFHNLDKDICASNTDKVEKNTSGEVDATVNDQCNSNILTRSRSKLNVTDDINKSTSDLIPNKNDSCLITEVDMGKCFRFCPS